MEVKIKGSDEESMFLNALHYTDKSLGEFITNAKKQSWWNNTLIVVISDHGHRLPQTPNRIDDFKISMLWLGGALNKVGIDYNKIGSQIDFPATLLKQISFDASSYRWSKNLFDPATPSWAYLTFNDGFGLIQPNRYFLFDNVGKKMIIENPKTDKHDLNLGKALQQKTFQDYLDK